MSWVSRLATGLDDRLNPIVVKEIRQAVHGRFLAGLLVFFLVFQLATLGFFLLSNGLSTIDLVSGVAYGQQVFGILIGILFFATVFCVPVYAAVRIYSERSVQNMALFFISTLSPRHIITGKLTSNIALVLLMISACMPYLSLTYFLRGIDLPTVFGALVVVLLVSVVAIQSAIFLAALEVARMLRVLIGLAGLGWLFTLFSVVLSFAIALPGQGVGSWLSSPDLWGPLTFLLALGAALVGLMFVLSVAIISPKTANRARPVRRYVLGVWLTSGVVTIYACFAHGLEDGVEAWQALWFVGFGLSFLLAICAPDQMSLRVAGEVPRALLPRWWAFFTFSGSANAVAFSLLLMALTAGTAEVLVRRFGVSLGDLPKYYLGFCGYCLAYSLLALWLQRRVIHRWIRRSQTWVVALAMAACFSLAPPITGFLLAPEAIARSPDFGLWMIANPFAPFQQAFGDLATQVGLGWAAAMLLLTHGWFKRQVRAFRPLAELAEPATVLSPSADSAAEGQTR